MTPAPVRKRGNSRGMAAWLGCAASAALAGLVRATSGPLPAPSETGARSRTTLRPSDRQLVGSSSGRPLRGPPVRGGKVSVSAEGQFRVSPNTLRGPARWVSLRSPFDPEGGSVFVSPGGQFWCRLTGSLRSPPRSPPRWVSLRSPHLRSPEASSVGVPSKPFLRSPEALPRWVSLRSPPRWVSLRSPPLRSPPRWVSLRSPRLGGCPFEAPSPSKPASVGVPSKPVPFEAPSPSKPASVGVPSKPVASVGVPSKPVLEARRRWVSLRSPPSKPASKPGSVGTTAEEDAADRKVLRHQRDETS